MIEVFKISNLKENKIFVLINQKKFSLIAFAFAFILMAWLLDPQPDMLMGGGDVTDIWNTITSFRSKDIYPSYVLYKGFLSIYPYVWFYELSSFLHMSPWFFIKLYQCLLFAYVAGVGIPFTIKNILKIKIKGYRQLLLPIILFSLFKSTMALTSMTVDLPSWAFFILAVNAALKIADKDRKKTLLLYLYAGLCIGLCMCLSGQYSLSAITIIIFIAIKTISKQSLIDKAKRGITILSVIILAFGVISVRSYNNYFEKTIVKPMRDSGAWLPTGGQWLELGLSRSIPKYEWSIPSNRGLAIIKDDKKANFEQEYKIMQNGGNLYTTKQLLKLIAKNPVDFIVKWTNTFFVSISFSNGANSVTYLFISYTSLFICLYLIFKKIKTWRKLFCAEALIPIAFIFSIAAIIVLQVELRCSLSIMSFIVAVGVLSDVFYVPFKKIGNIIISIIKRAPILLDSKNIPYYFVIYLVFMLICITHYGTIMEITGSDPARILFTK